MLEIDCLGACDLRCSRAYLACMGIEERRDALYWEEAASVPASLESMESVRSCAGSLKP